MEQGLIQKIHSIDGLELKLQDELTKLTTLQLKSIGDLIICKTEDSLVELMFLLNEYEQKFQIIGKSNKNNDLFKGQQYYWQG